MTDDAALVEKYEVRWRGLLARDGVIRRALAMRLPEAVRRTLQAERRDVRRELRDIERTFHFERPIHSKHR